MTLIASISGIRGVFGSGLDAAELVRYAAAYGAWCLGRSSRPHVVIGRDARVSGPVCAQIIDGTLRSIGCDVTDAGLATTPTVAMAVEAEKATGAVVISASHNPAEWNALKLLNEKGEYLSPREGREVMQLAEERAMPAASYRQIGTSRSRDYLDHHVRAILALPFCRADAVAERNFSVVVDGINSVGAIALPRLLEALGVRRIKVVNAEPTGLFAHPAEPLPEHLGDTLRFVRQEGADLGLVVDPDADRLALIDGEGRYVSEELTQVLAADFLWRRQSGPFVTNLSSSRAIEDVAARYGMPVYRSAVGEINVVKKMQETGALLGGEGNGGVILPELHYGRDGLLGAAMILQHLADEGTTLAAWSRSMPRYVISKNRLPLGTISAEQALSRVAGRYRGHKVSTLDGVKIDFDDGWVSLRKSNTEPILRVYAEARTRAQADRLAADVMEEIGRQTRSR